MVGRWSGLNGSSDGFQAVRCTAPLLGFVRCAPTDLIARCRWRGHVVDGSLEPDLAVAVAGLHLRGGLGARGCDRLATEVVEHLDTQAGAVGGRQQPPDQRRGDVQPVRDALQEQRAGLGHTRPADQLAVFGKDDTPPPVGR